MENRLQKMIDGFNEKVKRDKNLSDIVSGMERYIQLVVTDGKTYNMHLVNNMIEPLAIGEVDKPDIIVTSDTKTLMALMDGTMSPMKAYATKKVSFKASLQDMLLLKSLLM